MKRFLFFWILLFAGLISSAQSPFNVAFHTNSEIPVSNLVMIYGESYFLTQVSDKVDFGSTYINKHSLTGQKRFRSLFFSQFYGSVFESLDHKLIIWGKNNTCDVTDTSFIRERICKMDTNGTFVFNTSINLYPNGAWDMLKAVLQYSDSSYFAFSDSIMFKLDKNGQYLSKTALPFDKINSAVLLQNGNIAISCGFPWASTGTLYIINPSGQIVNTKTSITPIVNLKAFAMGQRVMGLGGNGKLYKFSNNLDLIASTQISNTYYNNFLVESDTIYAISNIEYKTLDTSLNQLSVSTCTTQQLTQRSISKSGNWIGVLSTCSRGAPFSPSFGFTALNVFNKNQSNNFNLDVELYELSADSSYAAQYSPFGYVYCYLRAKVRVVNKSNQTIKKISLSSYLFPYVVCGEKYYKQDFTDLSLQPGDTIVLKTNFIETRTYPSSSVSTVSYTWCLSTTCPNGENDKVAGNDMACQTYTSLVTNLPELGVRMDRLLVFPNPFSSNFTIQSDFEIVEVKVFNVLGGLIRSETGQRKEMVLSLPELETGIYFMRIETEHGVVTKKVVKN